MPRVLKTLFEERAVLHFMFTKLVGNGVGSAMESRTLN